MKTTFKVILLVAVLGLYPFQAESAPVGNIASPAMGKDNGRSFRLIGGFESDIIFDRKVKDMDGVDLNFYMGKLGISFNDRFLAYALLGSGSGNAEYTTSGSKVEYDTDSAFAWGIGAKAIFYETELSGFGNGILRFGGDIKYRYVEPDVSKVTIDGVVYDIPNADITDAVIEYGEFQGAIGLSYQINKFIPYMGVKFSSLSGDSKSTILGTEYKEDYEADNTVGMFLGADLVLADALSFNVEGRFIDEEAVNVGATIRF